MLRTLLKSKIHRATVTRADLHHVGSITIDADLIDAADLLPGGLVHVVDVTNGAAARLVQPGDPVIIIGYGIVPDAEVAGIKPKVIHVDAINHIVDVHADLSVSGGRPGSGQSSWAGRT